MQIQAFPELSIACSQALVAYRRVKYDGTNGLEYCGADDVGYGTLVERHIVSGLGASTRATVLSWQAPGTRKMVASGAISVNDLVYGAAAGKVSSTPSGTPIGRARTAATADGDYIEVLCEPFRAVNAAPFAATPDDAEGAGNSIPAGVQAVAVGAVTNDANDFVVLPSLADVPVGFSLLILCNAGGNFELRTPADSDEKINTVNSDGTAEYLCTDTDTIRVHKVSDTDGWVAQSIEVDGAVRTAVVPD